MPDKRVRTTSDNLANVEQSTGSTPCSEKPDYLRQLLVFFDGDKITKIDYHWEDKL